MATRSTLPTRQHQPIILVRGFGGLGVEEEKKLPYQGFNDGTVYPGKRGENYIFEGMVLRFMKSRWMYQDATNIVNYFSKPVPPISADLPDELKVFDRDFFGGHKIVIDQGMALNLLRSPVDPLNTLWVFRYYDLNDRTFATYGAALVRLINFIRALVKEKKGKDTRVNIIAHSMGGLIVRQAVQSAMPAQKLKPAELVNKIVTLGTPHQGISFQKLKHWIALDASSELEAFNPDHQMDKENPDSFRNFGRHFPLERLLTVVGTNYKSYNASSLSALNRLFSLSGEYGLNYNRSDGLVKQTFAQLPGAPRTFIHKCHGGQDSLVTSREAFEIASRFFFGNVHACLHLVSAKVKRGFDLIGKSEMFFGISIKPRGVDFDLFHQSAEAENCYGPFFTADFSDSELAFDWAGKDRLIWEGWLDKQARATGGYVSDEGNDMVMRLDVYVGERDLLGLGFSDNVIFRKQYYLRSLEQKGKVLMQLYTGEEFREGARGKLLKFDGKGWVFTITGTGFTGELRIVLSTIPETGKPEKWTQDS